MKYKMLGIAVVMILIVGGYWMFANKQEGESSGSERVVRVGYITGIFSYLHVVAVDQGLYERAGIKVEATEFQSGNQLYDALAQGKIDVSPQASTFPILANHITDPGRVKVFSISRLPVSTPYDQLVVLPDSPIRQLSDLAGKKVGISPGGTGGMFLKDFLSKRRVDISKTEFVLLPFPNQIQALEAGSIDALYAYEPNRTKALVVDHARSIDQSIFASYFEDNPQLAGALSAQFAVEEPLLAKKVVGAYDQAVDFSEQNETQLRTILNRELRLDSEVVRQMNLIHEGRSTEIDRGKLQELVDLLLAIGGLKSQPDLSTLIYR